MALSDLAVYSEYSYSAFSESLAQQIELFNEASRGAIALSTQTTHQGDYSDTAFWKLNGNLTRKRDVYGNGNIAQEKMQHIVDTMVRIAAGTPEIEMDPSQLRWIQVNQREAGAAMGQQLAQAMLADMLNTGIIACRTALSQVAEVNYDATGGTLTAGALNRGLGLFGDRRDTVAAWIAHSAPMADYYGNAIANAERLFTYGTVNVAADPFGKVFVMTDSPSLVTTGAPDKYHTLGLTPGAIIVDQNNDFDDNWQKTNGKENIARSYQAEWSYNLGIKGFAWDKTGGGKSPNDAAIAAAANWDRYATNAKDLAGVVVTSQ